jgi:hypothetical protein
MIVCPVCENQQAAGFVCDVCGKDLGAAMGDGALLAPLEPEIPRMPDLEQSGAANTPNVPIQPMPDLEVNIGAAGTPNVPIQPMPDLEATIGAAGTANVPVQPMPDLELDRAEFVGQKTAAPGAQIQCRYCGNVQAKGAICEKCGMRLPRAKGTDTAAAAAKGKKPVELVRCKFCGSPGHEGERCGECGRIVVPKTA